MRRVITTILAIAAILPTFAQQVYRTEFSVYDLREAAIKNDHSRTEHHIPFAPKSLEMVENVEVVGQNVELPTAWSDFNIYAHIQDVAGIRVICNYLDDIRYLRRLLTRTESFKVIREVDYIKEPKESGYRSLHLVVEVPIVISEGTLHLPVEVQLRTIAMDMWASLEHELRYKSDRNFSEKDADRLRLCSEAIGEIDREMQNIYLGEKPEYEV